MTDRPSRSPSRSPNPQRSTSFAGARLHFNYTGKEQKIRSRHDTPRLSNTPTSSDSNRLDYGQYDPKSRSRTGSSIEVPVAPQKSPSPIRRVTQPVYFEDIPQTASLYGPSVRKSPSPSRRQTQQVNTQDLERARVELYSTSVGRNRLHPNQNQEVSSYRPTSSPIQNQSLPTSSSYIPNSQNPNLSISQNQKQTSSQVLNPQNQNPSLQNPIVPTSTSSRPSLYTGHSRYNTPEAIRRSEDFRSQRDSDGRLGLGAIGRQRSLGPLEASTRPQEFYTSMQRSIGASELQESTIGSRRPQESEGPQAPSLTPRHSSLVSNLHESPGQQGPPRHSTSVSRQPFDPSYLPVTATPPRNPSFSSYSTYDTPPVPVPQPPPPVASSSFISKVLDPFGQIPKQNLNPPRPPPHQRSPRSMTLDVASSSHQQSDIEEAKRRIRENQKMIEKAEEARKAAVRAREEAERKEKLRREEEEKRREEAARKAAETARKVAEETARKAAEEAARLAAMEDEDEEVTKFIHRLHEQIRDSRESKNAMGALGGRRINTNLATNAENLTNVHKNELLICVF